jgi:hypothetical protein
MLRLYLRPIESAKLLRSHDERFPPQLRELLDRLLAWTEQRLHECGEVKPRKRGRPAEHPAVVEATRLLSNAGFTPSRITRAIGNEIAAVRETTRRTRNGKSYEKPRDLRRTLRRHRGKKSR